MKNYDELKALIEQRGVHEVFGAYGEGWGIEQSAAELAQFLVHMQELGVESVLEIGTGWKAGLARFLHDDMGWTVTSVDIHDYGHQFGGITFVSGLGSVEGRFDLVIIDGDHSYEAVQHDHVVWSIHATKVIAFHDIAGLRDCEGVRNYWIDNAWSVARAGNAVSIDLQHKLKTGYYELVAEGDQRGGIGYIVLAEVQDAPAETKAAEAPKPKPTRKPAAKRTEK